MKEIPLNVTRNTLMDNIWNLSIKKIMYEFISLKSFNMNHFQEVK